ncbi:MAG: hypothetical protein JSS66_14600 [Armatimonadetes bacterium]|nr:hypothetical protein [Armatimonadota bacterium]
MISLCVAVFASSAALYKPVPLADDELHPIFSMNPDILRAAYARGREAAKSKNGIQKLIDPFDIDIGKVRSPSNVRWQAPRALFRPPFVTLEIKGYQDAREYKDNSEAMASIKAQTDPPTPPENRRIRFFVQLFAWPGINDYTGAILRDARQEDVRDVKFVVLIDGDPARAVHPYVKPTATSEATYDGSVSIPEFNTVSSSSSGTASASGSGGYASGTYNSTSHVTYVTHRTEEYSSYQADYELEFPLYDKNGNPYVTAKTKKLVLKVVRPTGEHTGVWELPQMSKSMPKG